MSAIQRLKGFQDILPEDQPYWEYFMSTAADLARRYGFSRVDVPIIEKNSLFERGVGTASDFFVKKEMYSIEESDGDLITLRPEFTAGLVRAYVQNGMQNWTQPVKLFTFGPIFRRERPQAGRFRQHNQFDCEILGETDPVADLEVMLVAINLYREMGYRDLTFQLNSVGCPVCKPVFVEALTAFMQEHLDKLSEIDRERLQRNPQRILDSKDPGIDDLLARAPRTIDYLCEDCGSHFADLRLLLERVGESYTINHRLVRGIDYYTKTAFEVWDQRIGAQSALMGGGRYDGLAEAIGGPSTPGVGFGMGIERAVLGLKAEEIVPPALEEPHIFVAHFGGETKIAAVEIASRLRQEGLGVRMAFARDRRSLKSQMRESNKYPIQFVLIVGEDEYADNLVTVKDFQSGGEQLQVPLDQLSHWLADRLS
ncbi:MAG: histidine--tRNA ligase [Ardenticatenaceae bacterium]|nr:histidine--tRNA ligase [Ardenticatenaceae bacterium]